MCNSSSKASYFQCVKSAWQQMTCTAGTECRTVNNKAVCADPNAPVESSTSTETKVACDTNNSTMCDASDKSAFYMCTDKFWTKMQCDGANVCMARDGKTACVDQATADAPVLPCTVANATQCAPDNQKIFQICIDDYWTNSTCADDNYCLLRGDSAVCVDKATANAPVLPCTTAKATRCIDGAPQKYQFCYDGYWSNSTCTDNNYCLFRGESALCVDKATAEAPVQPCTKANATRCVDEDELIYQLCYDGFWSNSTCDTGNVCRMPDTGKNAVCMDKDEAYLSITMSTLHEPTPFRGTISMGVSVRDALSWGPSVVLGALAIAFGVGI
ncbi:hypothetical protein LPJ63_003939 [Coemansia sp. RSA 2711]|nr:hypothetical protein LPJ63_003939 [Coemansia sp. RSA 2711]KAJ2325037.1 hypothetical protein IWW51_002988 [Coemansia sp. RSA 2702]